MGVINAVNLLDGLDGLAAGVVMIAFISLAIAFGLRGETSWVGLALVVVGAASGFLIYNHHPASIFMGDSGSMFLGFLLAVFAVGGSGDAPSLFILFVPLLALGLPLLDTGLSIVRRLQTGQSPFMADRDHIHHRVLQQVEGHASAVRVLHAISVVFGAFAVLVSRLPLLRSVILLLILSVLLYLLFRTLGYVPQAAGGLLHRGVRRWTRSPGNSRPVHE